MHGKSATTPPAAAPPPTTAHLLRNLDPDKVLEKFGKYGRYQMSVYLMVAICFFVFAYLTTIISLVGEAPEYCDNPENANSTFVDNNQDGSITIAKDFGITCANKNMLEHANGAFMLGNFVNTPLSTYLADRYGRRLTFLIPLWLVGLLSIACAFSPNYTLFLLFRFLSGTCGAAVSVVGFVMTVESVAGSFRPIQALINATIWVSGIFAVGIFHMYIQNWRHLYLIVVLPGLISIVYYWIFPESLHWLVANNKTSEIRRYIIKSSRINGVTLNLNDCQLEFNANKKTKADSAVTHELEKLDAPMGVQQRPLSKPLEVAVKRRGFQDIMRSPALCFHLFLHCYIYIVLNFVYWVLTLYSVDMHENKMVGFFLSATVELPAGLIAMLLLFFFGRRTVTILSLLGQTISIGLTIFTPQGSTLNLILSLLAKILNTVAWASEPLLLSEMAPTTVRNMFYGLVSTAGEIGSVFAPYLKWIGEEHKQKAVIASMSVVAILFSMMSPETGGKPLPQDIEDFDSGQFLHALRKCCCPTRGNFTERRRQQQMKTTANEEKKNGNGRKIDNLNGSVAEERNWLKNDAENAGNLDEVEKGNP